MTVLAIILPILSLLLITFFAVRFIEKRNSFLRASLVWKVIGGYFAILLVLPVIYYATAKEEEVTHDEQEAVELYTLLLNGEIEQIEEKYVKKTWNFHYEKETIRISKNIDRMSIVIDRTDKLSDEIAVTLYQSPLIFLGMDLYEKVQPPEIELVVDSLLINELEQDRVEAIVFKGSMVEGQFLGARSWLEQLKYPNFRTNVLYIQISKDVKVVVDSEEVHYVSK